MFKCTFRTNGLLLISFTLFRNDATGSVHCRCQPPSDSLPAFSVIIGKFLFYQCLRTIAKCNHLACIYSEGHKIFAGIIIWTGRFQAVAFGLCLEKLPGTRLAVLVYVGTFYAVLFCISFNLYTYRDPIYGAFDDIILF